MDFDSQFSIEMDLFPEFEIVQGQVTLISWIGAKCTVCQGVTAMPYSMLAVGSVASHDLDACGIYRGNPAVKVKERVIER